MSAAQEPSASACGSRPRDKTMALLRLAGAAIADHAERGLAWRASPLVIVTAETEAWGRCLEDLRRSCGVASDIRAWDGRELGREVARAGEGLHRLRDRLAVGPLLVVTALEGLGGQAVQLGFATILDAAAAAGTSVCVTTAHHPGADTFLPALASRLSAGLVLPFPATPPSPARHLTRSSGGVPSVAAVIRTTARQLGLAPATLVGQGRSRSVAQARSLAMYLSRQLTGRSLGDIGRALGGRDHSTVIHGIRKAAAHLLEDRGFARDADTIAGELLRLPRRRPAPEGRRSG